MRVCFFMKSLEKYIEEKSKEVNLQSIILVAKGPEVLVSRSSGYAHFENRVEICSTTKFKLASITKQFITVLILKLAQEGRVDLHAPIKKILGSTYRGWKNCVPVWANQVTLHHILSNCSGIPDYINLPEFQPLFEIPHSKDIILNLIFAQDLVFEPGTKYDYSNSGFVLLGEIIENVTGQPYQDHLSEIILKPIDLESTQAVVYQKGGEISSSISENKDYAQGYLRSHSTPNKMTVKSTAFPMSDYAYQTTPDGSLLSTAHDLHQWNLALYKGKIINTSFLEKMLSPHIPIILPRAIAVANNKLSIHYGYGIACVFDPRTNTTFYRHGGLSGGFRTELVYCPENEVSVVVLSNATWSDQKEDPMRDMRKLAQDLLNIT